MNASSAPTNLLAGAVACSRVHTGVHYPGGTAGAKGLTGAR